MLGLSSNLLLLSCRLWKSDSGTIPEPSSLSLASSSKSGQVHLIVSSNTSSGHNLGSHERPGALVSDVFGIHIDSYQDMSDHRFSLRACQRVPARRLKPSAGILSARRFVYHVLRGVLVVCNTRSFLRPSWDLRGGFCTPRLPGYVCPLKRVVRSPISASHSG